MRRVGVIEAYYGRQWSWADRYAVIGQLPELGLDQYVYAPKADASLRKRWREPFSESQEQALCEMVRCCKLAGVAAGIGFTPRGLISVSERGARQALRSKAAELAALELDLLYILFDDLPSSGDSMAIEQLRIVEELLPRCGVSQVVVCPSYYSTDPVLEKVFGPRPRDYWQQLGAGLDQRIGLCWTGAQVCSESYSRDNLAFIAEAYRRLPVLWDNYPVNDSAKLSLQLRLYPFTGRERWLADYTAAHMANPMNQPLLSLLPLASLARLYSAAGTVNCDSIQVNTLPQAWGRAAESISRELVAQLAADAEDFQSRGRDTFPAERKTELLARYCSFREAQAREVMDWLNGEYAFDPECLTD
ncbi:MAG: beta-N-acetylglucosaminidase domain-containing protein [Pseudomonadales bacterium]